MTKEHPPNLYLGKRRKDEISKILEGACFKESKRNKKKILR